MHHTSPQTPRLAIHGVGTFIGVCFGLFVFVAATTFVCLRLFPGEASSTHRLVAHFSGNGDGSTAPFTVDDEWEFRWTHDGRIEQIIWRRADGEQDLLMEMPGKPIRYQGGVDYTAGGEYTMEIKGTGNWTIDVYQF